MIKVWKPGMSEEEANSVGLWERNMLALRYSDGYFDEYGVRGLSLLGGRIVVIVPPEFEVGNLPLIKPVEEPATLMSMIDSHGYRSRNILARVFADGWYEDIMFDINGMEMTPIVGWSRVLSCDGGKMNFHIPDNFEVGDVPKIDRTWDGHTTEEKWKRVLEMKGIVFHMNDKRHTLDTQLNA